MHVLPLLAILLYGLLHSVLAASSMKAASRKFLGDRLHDGVYRLFFNIMGAVTFLPVVWIVLASPSIEVWRVSMPFSAVLMAVQGVALVCLSVAVLQADPLRFAGISQVIAYVQGHPLPLPPEKLQTGGFYGFVRHPLYLFSLLVLWPMPVMTSTFLGFAIGSTIYFLIGSRLEERRLMSDFGQEYEDYRKRVPWLLPKLTLRV